MTRRVTVITIEIETVVTASIPSLVATPASAWLNVTHETVVEMGHTTKAFRARNVTIVVVPTGSITG